MAPDNNTFSEAEARLQVMSDLHLETPRFMPMYDDFNIKRAAPYLALLGDIGNVHDGRLFSFLQSQLRKFEIVFYVLGNHEPYTPDDQGITSPTGASCTYDAAISIMKDFEAANITAIAKETQEQTNKDNTTPLGRFVFLHQRRFDLTSTITILGTTLFSHITNEQRPTSSIFISDFSNIERWSVDNHNAAHAADLAWLNHQVEVISQEAESGSPKRSIVILTHYSPTSLPQANDPDHLDDNRGVQSAFVTNLAAEPCWLSPNVRAWAFGHTHYNCDFVEEASGKRIVANQRGYGREDSFNFDPDKVIKLD